MRILKRKQNITRVSGKSTKDVTTYCREPAHQQELFRFVSAVLELEQLFLGLTCLSLHHLRPWSYLRSCECYHWRSWKKCFSESDETRKNCFCLRVKNNSLKDRISKALADDKISGEEFENILAEMEKYHELKKDIRVGLKKKQGQKNGGWRSPTGGFRRSKSITPRDSCGNTQKTSIRRRPSKIEASLFFFSEKIRFGC